MSRVKGLGLGCRSWGSGSSVKSRVLGARCGQCVKLQSRRAMLWKPGTGLPSSRDPPPAQPRASLEISAPNASFGSVLDTWALLLL
eukprot:2074547-Rhodomonas_salina.1